MIIGSDHARMFMLVEKFLATMFATKIEWLTVAIGSQRRRLVNFHAADWIKNHNSNSCFGQ
jgi:hypothetical protein